MLAEHFAFSINAGRRGSQATLEAAVCAFEWLCHTSSSGDRSFGEWHAWKVAVCLEVATGQLPSYRGSKQQQEYQNTVHYHADKDGEAHPSLPHNLTPLYTAEQVAHFIGHGCQDITITSLVPRREA